MTTSFSSRVAQLAAASKKLATDSVNSNSNAELGAKVLLFAVILPTVLIVAANYLGH